MYDLKKKIPIHVCINPIHHLDSTWDYTLTRYTSNASIMALRSNEIPDFFLDDWFWAGTLRIPAGPGWPRDLGLRLSSLNICCSRLISASSSSAACCTNSNFFLRRREFRTKVWSPVGSAKTSDRKGHFGEFALFS